jgi:hypothetical protein
MSRANEGSVAVRKDGETRDTTPVFRDRRNHRGLRILSRLQVFEPQSLKRAGRRTSTGGAIETPDPPSMRHGTFFSRSASSGEASRRRQGATTQPTRLFPATRNFLRRAASIQRFFDRPLCPKKLR